MTKTEAIVIQGGIFGKCTKEALSFIFRSFMNLQWPPKCKSFGILKDRLTELMDFLDISYFSVFSPFLLFPFFVEGFPLPISVIVASACLPILHLMDYCLHYRTKIITVVGERELSSQTPIFLELGLVT